MKRLSTVEIMRRLHHTIAMDIDELGDRDVGQVEAELWGGLTPGDDCVTLDESGSVSAFEDEDEA